MSNFAQRAYACASHEWLSIIAVIVALIIGFFAGREYLKYEIRSAMKDVQTGVSEAMSGIYGVDYVPYTASTEVTDPTTETLVPNVPNKLASDFTITVLNYRILGQEIEEGYMSRIASQGMSFMAVGVSLTNDSNIEKFFDAEEAKLRVVSTEGRQYRPLQYLYLVGFQEPLNGKNIPAGMTFEGNIIFEVPESLEYFTVCKIIP